MCPYLYLFSRVTNAVDKLKTKMDKEKLKILEKGRQTVSDQTLLVLHDYIAIK